MQFYNLGKREVFMNSQNNFKNGLQVNNGTKSKSTLDLGLLTKDEIERIKIVCREPIRDGNGFSKIQKDGTVNWLYDMYQFENALLKILLPRLSRRDGYDYNDIPDEAIIRYRKEVLYLIEMNEKIDEGTCLLGADDTEYSIDCYLALFNVPIEKEEKSRYSRE